MSGTTNPAGDTCGALPLAPPILIVTTHMGDLLAIPMQIDMERQRRRIQTPCEQCGDSDMVDAVCRTWGELDDELMALAGDGWADDALTDIANLVCRRYHLNVDERAMGELEERLHERAAQWWDDNETTEEDD